MGVFSQLFILEVSDILTFAFCLGSMSISTAEVARYRAMRAQIAQPENTTDGAEQGAGVQRGTSTIGSGDDQESLGVVNLTTPR